MMTDHQPYHILREKFRRDYRCEPGVIAYAPGRVEVLGNHTDYNEGLVLSAAIDVGTFFACGPRRDGTFRLTAADVDETVEFLAAAPEASRAHPWANYVKGVLAGLAHGCDAMFLGDIPLGSGLSSSAALEICAGLALARLYGIAVDPLDMARIGQAAEHRFAGVKCGLMDQISSLFGRNGTLVETDFRSLAVRNVPLGRDVCLLICNTHARHALVDGEYNRRREACEFSARYFATVLPHPVRALRDVSRQEWEAYRGGLSALMARRAIHPIGENERVMQGARLLAHNDLAGFGRLMYESHESSRTCFENSCPELDLLVEAARPIPGVLGARLSGGGFGGSVVVLTQCHAAAAAGAALAEAYGRAFGKPCDARILTPSDGAHVVMG